MKLPILVLTAWGLLMFLTAAAQQQPEDSSHLLIDGHYPEGVSFNATKAEQQINTHSLKALRQLQKQEQKILRKLAKTDSLKAKQLMADAQGKYKDLEAQINSKTVSVKQYIPSLDTLGSSLRFLQQNPQLLSPVKEATKKMDDALGKVQELQSSLQKAADIQQFLKERKQYLQQQLQQLGFAKQLKKLNKQVYYYSRQLGEYKALLKDHKKAERKALALLSRTQRFKDFMRKNSQLASLFRMPGDPNDPLSMASLAGLQTRAQVNNLIQQQVAAGGSNGQQQFRQNLQEAQSQLNQLKEKMRNISSSGGNDGDAMAEGFKPNNQKTKRFRDRLEYGTNIQSQKPNGYFPVTSDIGVSLGYHLNDKSIVGIGASYKLGLGQNIRNINITNQGAGVRSFVDWKIKGGFWISGGYEMNYRSAFNRIEALKDLNAWQQSGLIGMSKVVSLRSKFFKKTKLQLLWDFLSYEQVPRVQPVVFRIGYNLK